MQLLLLCHDRPLCSRRHHKTRCCVAISARWMSAAVASGGHPLVACWRLRDEMREDHVRLCVSVCVTHCVCVFSSLGHVITCPTRPRGVQAYRGPRGFPGGPGGGRARCRLTCMAGKHINSHDLEMYRIWWEHVPTTCRRIRETCSDSSPPQGPRREIGTVLNMCSIIPPRQFVGVISGRRPTKPAKLVSP